MTELELIDQISDKKQQAVIRALYSNRPKDLPSEPNRNTWYVYRPKNCVCSDGTPYYSTLRIGTQNKLMIMFCGGGVAMDAYSAARPNKLIPEAGKQTFYIPNTTLLGYFYGQGGIASNQRSDNPFYDWSVLIVQYATGDFHCGMNDFSYNDAELGAGICHHHGYKNYSAMLDKMRQLVPDPDQILVTGFSAGGFGTALLTDDIMQRYPLCKDVTCLVDSATFSYRGSHETAVHQWKAPKEVCDRLVSDDLVLDSLLALHKKRGNNVKIAFTCTHRDALLSQCQNYFDGKGMTFSKEGGDHFNQVLGNLVHTLLASDTSASVFLFDKPHPEIQEGGLTEHTIIASDLAYTCTYDGHQFVEWLVNVINGKPACVGLELVQQ